MKPSRLSTGIALIALLAAILATARSDMPYTLVSFRQDQRTVPLQPPEAAYHEALAAAEDLRAGSPPGLAHPHAPPRAPVAPPPPPPAYPFDNQQWLTAAAVLFALLVLVASRRERDKVADGLR